MRFVRHALVALAASALAGAAFAQSFPSKPIRLIVPFPPGSATDTIGRILAASVQQSIGQPVMIDNRAGADGAIAGAEAAKAAADGYTLLLATNSPMSAVPAMRKQPPYDPIADFTPITDIGRYTFFYFVNAQVPARTMAEFVAHARANPGKLNYATGNTTGIVSFAQFNALAGIDMVHIPYKGEPAGIADLVSGRVQAMFATPTTGLAFAREGKLRILATSLPRRSPLMPETPTMAEVGFPKFTITSWAGLYGPARLPREIVERLNHEFTSAMRRPEVMEQMAKQAFFLNPSTPEQLAALTRSQLEEYRRILREAGVQPE